MPKLPVITAKTLVSTLKKLGFHPHHQTGSHLQMKHPDGRRTTIPVHSGKDIRKGTLRAILRDLNLDPANFIQLLRSKK